MCGTKILNKSLHHSVANDILDTCQCYEQTLAYVFNYVNVANASQLTIVRYSILNIVYNIVIVQYEAHIATAPVLVVLTFLAIVV